MHLLLALLLERLSQRAQCLVVLAGGRLESRVHLPGAHRDCLGREVSTQRPKSLGLLRRTLLAQITQRGGLRHRELLALCSQCARKRRLVGGLCLTLRRPMCLLQSADLLVMHRRRVGALR